MTWQDDLPDTTIWADLAFTDTDITAARENWTGDNPRFGTPNYRRQHNGRVPGFAQETS